MSYNEEWSGTPVESVESYISNERERLKRAAKSFERKQLLAAWCAGKSGTQIAAKRKEVRERLDTLDQERSALGEELLILDIAYEPEMIKACAEECARQS